MPAPQSQQPSDVIFRNGPRIAFVFLHAWSTSVEVFLRCDFGSRYLGVQAAAVLLLVPLYASSWGPIDTRPLLWFLLAYMGMCFVARMGMLRRHLRGEHYHSYYNGWPRLMRLLPKCKERNVKMYVEPAVVCFVAFLVHDDCPPLCIYLLVAALAVFATQAEAEMQHRKRAHDMHDAVLEQEYLAERFRELRQKRW